MTNQRLDISFPETRVVNPGEVETPGRVERRPPQSWAPGMVIPRKHMHPLGCSLHGVCAEESVRPAVIHIALASPESVKYPCFDVETRRDSRVRPHPRDAHSPGWTSWSQPTTLPLQLGGGRFRVAGGSSHHQPCNSSQQAILSRQNALCNNCDTMRTP